MGLDQYLLLLLDRFQSFSILDHILVKKICPFYFIEILHVDRYKRYKANRMFEIIIYGVWKLGEILNVFC